MDTLSLRSDDISSIKILSLCTEGCGRSTGPCGVSERPCGEIFIEISFRPDVKISIKMLSLRRGLREEHGAMRGERDAIRGERDALREMIFIELMTSGRKLKASIEGSK